ncbi:hypothetical protein HanRHA438_Chr07g0307571 [Helianthus annuus]|nr:hypothetical protein HanRHA438_Chr07g0307571 [Helianthus annuus]
MASRAAYMSACFIGFEIFGFSSLEKPYGRNFYHGSPFVFQDINYTCIKLS